MSPPPTFAPLFFSPRSVAGTLPATKSLRFVHDPHASVSADNCRAFRGDRQVRGLCLLTPPCACWLRLSCSQVIRRRSQSTGPLVTTWLLLESQHRAKVAHKQPTWLLEDHIERRTFDSQASRTDCSEEIAKYGASGDQSDPKEDGKYRVFGRQLLASLHWLFRGDR
jgi:hypothetical protein